MTLLPAFADAEKIGYYSAQWAVTLALAIPAAVALQWAIKAPTQSQRYNWLAYFFGLLLLVQIEIPLELKNSPGLSLMMGAMRILGGGLGVLCTLRALHRRRQDKGVGWAGPLFGALLCMIHATYGVTLLALPRITQTGAVGESWVYQSEADHYSITLPSKQWSQARIEGASSAFRCRVLSVQLGVFIQQQTRAQYDQSVQDHARRKDVSSLRDFQSESGKTTAGNDYFMTSGFEKEIQVRTCFIYRPQWNQTLTVICEWIPQMKSQAGRISEQSSMEVAVRAAILSIR